MEAGVDVTAWANNRKRRMDIGRARVLRVTERWRGAAGREHAGRNPVRVPGASPTASGNPGAPGAVGGEPLRVSARDGAGGVDWVDRPRYAFGGRGPKPRTKGWFHRFAAATFGARSRPPLQPSVASPMPGQGSRWTAALEFTQRPDRSQVVHTHPAHEGEAWVGGVVLQLEIDPSFFPARFAGSKLSAKRSAYEVGIENAVGLEISREIVG